MGFLRTYGLEKEYQINVEANHATLAGHTFEHDLEIASRYGQLGSIDANVGDAQLGWDTDQFNMDIHSTTLAMLVVMNQGGLPVGINFDAKVRRESTDVEDMFIAHIGGMDSFARGLLNADKIRQDGTKADWIAKRYSSFDTGIGADFEKGKVGFKELEKFALENGEPKQISGQQEKYEVLLNQYL
jgi:xylose isomerase